MEPATTTRRPRRRASPARRRDRRSPRPERGRRWRGAPARPAPRRSSPARRARSCRRSIPSASGGRPAREHAGDVLVAHRAEHERRSRHAGCCEIGRQRRAPAGLCAASSVTRTAVARSRCSSRAGQRTVVSPALTALGRHRAIRLRQRLEQPRSPPPRLPIWCAPASAERASPGSAPVDGAHVDWPPSAPSAVVDSVAGAHQRRLLRLRRRARDHPRRPRGRGPQTTGTPGLMMPAFSAAIDVRSSPELGLVIEVDRGDRGDDGVTTLVASRRPPSPTSSTARSTAPRRNSSKPIAVVHSKKVGRPSSVPVGEQPLDGRADARRRRPQSPAVVDLPAVQDEALLEPTQVRRGVARGAMPGGAAAPSSTMAVTEPLPLVPRDRDRAEGALGMAERGAERWRCSRGRTSSRGVRG